MRIDKEHVLQALRSHGLHEEAEVADRVLDAHVDTQVDGPLLRGLGLDPDARSQGGNLALLPPGQRPPRR